MHQTYKKLTQLNLSNNAIRGLDYVALLSKIPTLQTLDLSANPITDMTNYRQNLFERLPNLQGLDGYNQEGSECASFYDQGEEDIENDTDYDADNFDEVFKSLFTEDGLQQKEE